MFAVQTTVSGTLSVNITDATITNGIRLLMLKYGIKNIRECFESYCYTDERCAVSEEFYSDMEDSRDSSIKQTSHFAVEDAYLMDGLTLFST